MAMILDPEAHARLRKVAGRRLKKSRITAGCSLKDAREAVGYTNDTQLSLVESGERFLPLPALLILCDLYGVPMDYVVGRIDDPLAEPFEVCHGVVAGLVTKAIGETMEKFTAATSEHVAIALASQRQDRVDVTEMIRLVREMVDAYRTVKRLNPSFDDEVRGASRVESLINRLSALASGAAIRVEKDRKLSALIDRRIRPDAVVRGVEQFRLDFEIEKEVAA